MTQSKVKVSCLLSRVNKWRFQGVYTISDFNNFAKRLFDGDKLNNYKGVRFINIETKKVITEIYKEKL